MFDSMREVGLIMPLELCNHRSRLSVGERQAYDEIVRAIVRREKNVTFRKPPVCDWQRLFDAIRCDQSMLFFYKGPAPEIYTVQRGADVRFRVGILYRDLSNGEIEAMIDRMDSRLRLLVPRRGSELKRELLVHNRMQALNLKAGESVPGVEVDWKDHCIVGPLLFGHTVCEGASHLFRLLCAMCGVQCYNIVGTGTDSEGKTGDHSWNIVKLGNEYVHVDAFWDLLHRGDDKDNYRYDYFNLSDARIGVDHTWDRPREVRCTSDKFSFFALNRAECPTMDAFVNHVREVYRKGGRRVYVRLGFNTTKEELIDRVKEIPSDPRVKEYGYSFAKPIRVFDLLVRREGDE